jgi:hypothetical protein
MAARTGQLLFGGRGLNGPRNRMDECCCFPGSSSPRGNSVLSVGGRPGNNSVAPVPVQRQREPEGSIAFPCSDTTSRQHAAPEAVYVGLDGRWWTKPAPSPLAGTKMGNVKTAVRTRLAARQPELRLAGCGSSQRGWTATAAWVVDAGAGGGVVGRSWGGGLGEANPARSVSGRRGNAAALKEKAAAKRERCQGSWEPCPTRDEQHQRNAGPAAAAR